MGEGEVRWHRPLVYQEKDGARQLVAARYAITSRNRVGFEVAEYDARRPLYIDPVTDTLIYSTYLGGSGEDTGLGIAVDSAGDAYGTGWTSSPGFPTRNPLPPGNRGGSAAFGAKLQPPGAGLGFASALGERGRAVRL